MTSRVTTPRFRTSHVIVAAVVLGVSLVAALGWTAWRVWDAAGALQRVADAGRTAMDAVGNGDLRALQTSLADIARYGAQAGDAASTPLWPVASAMPVLGDDVAAIGALARAAGTLGATLAAPAAHALTTTGDDAGSLGRLAPSWAPATAGVAEAQADLASIDTTHLTGPVSKAVDQMREALGRLGPSVATARAAAAVAASLDQGTSSVLVLLQNGAELRTGGGITGAVALLQVTDGNAELVAQADSSMFPNLTSPIMPVTAAQDALYGDVVGRFVQNASMPTDFAETAALATAWWQRLGHPAPDLVVSIDVPAIGALLRVTGPVTLPDGTILTGDDIVQRLLVEPYTTMDSAQQTVFLQSAVSSAVAGLSTQQIDPLRWLSALATPIAEGRVSVWSADASTQELLAVSSLGGPSARLAAAGPDAFAVYLNDGTGGKMDVYLDVELSIVSAVCRPDGRADVHVRATMASSAPADAEHVLAGDVTGRGLFGTGAGDIGTSISVSAPPGSYFGGVTKNGKRALSVDVDDAGRPTSLIRVNLSPAETNDVDFHFIMGSPGALTPSLLHTPMLNTPTVSVESASCG